MSEKNGSFDEALRIIEKEADMLSPYSLRGDDRESLYQAIRVLEAAGKVDKSVEKICALLESLPDEEQK